ncbi:MAG: peptide chain release factor aRF-1 [Promethearchaeota archaeon]
MPPTMKKHGRSTIDYYRVQRDLEILKNKRGYHTELISVYIPANRPLSAVSNYLKNELSESSNIKSKTTRKHVMDAITSLIAKLKVLPKSETGYILFDGFIPKQGPGTEREESYVIIPPEPVKTFRYHCSSEFLLEPLEEMLKDKSSYGLISIGRKEAAIAVLHGKHVKTIQSLTSGIHGKHRAGGQSQRRFERLIEEAAREFYKRIGEHANQILGEVEDLKGIIVGGPGYSKYEFLDGPFLRQEFKDLVIETPDTDADGELGIRRLLQKSEDILKETEFIKEKKLIERFMSHIAKDTGMVVYGLHETIDALKNAAVELLILSEEINLYHVYRICSSCGKRDDFYVPREEIDQKMEELSSGECPECKSGYNSAEINAIDVVEFLGSIAQEVGTDVTIVSGDTEEGAMFHATFGGIGGFLRYKYNS